MPSGVGVRPATEPCPQLVNLTCTDAVHGGRRSILSGTGRRLSKIEWQKEDQLSQDSQCGASYLSISFTMSDAIRSEPPSRPPSLGVVSLLHDVAPRARLVITPRELLTCSGSV